MKNPEIVIRRLNDDRAFACYYKGDYENQSGHTHKLWTFSLLVTRNFASDLYNAISHLITAHDTHDKNSEFILQQLNFYKVYIGKSVCIDKRIQFTMSPIELSSNNNESDCLITKADIEAINNFIDDICDEMYNDHHYNKMIHMMINDASNTPNTRILTAYSLSSDRLKDKDYMEVMMKYLNGATVPEYYYKEDDNATMWCNICHYRYHALTNEYYYMGNRIVYNTQTNSRNIEGEKEKKVLDRPKIEWHRCIKGVVGRTIDFLNNKEDNNTSTNDDMNEYLLVLSTMYDMDIINESNMKLKYVRCDNCGSVIKEYLPE